MNNMDNNINNHDKNNMEYDTFLRTFLKILNKYAPMKKKYWRAKEVRKRNYD